MPAKRRRHPLLDPADHAGSRLIGEVVSHAADADHPVDLAVSHYMPPDHGTHRDFVEPWARAVEVASGGRLRVTVHDGDSALGRLGHQHAQVVSGVVDVAHSVATLPAGRFPRTAIVGAPFVAASAAIGTQLLSRLFSRYLAVEYAHVAVLVLHADSGGLLHTRQGPIGRLEDLRGLRVRAPSDLVASALAELGARPIVLPPVRFARRPRLVASTAPPWRGTWSCIPGRRTSFAIISTSPSTSRRSIS